jgi:hypothetical protein
LRTFMQNSENGTSALLTHGRVQSEQYTWKRSIHDFLQKFLHKFFKSFSYRHKKNPNSSIPHGLFTSVHWINWIEGLEKVCPCRGPKIEIPFFDWYEQRLS